jgi:hypothetical protein
LSRRERPSPNHLDVALIEPSNCPFDGASLPIFRVIVFTVARCGLHPRGALEVHDSAHVGIEKIARIIEECPIGIHDIPRADPDSVNNLPRFTMRLEVTSPVVV